MKKAALAALLAPVLFVGALILFLVVLAAPPPASASCTGGAGVDVAVGDLPASVGAYSGGQLAGAAAIMRAGRDAGLSVRGQTIGVMVAIGESSLTAVDHGDAVGPDSLGWFQQRDPWGPRDARLDAYRSATMFFTGGRGGQAGLLDIPGWEAMTPTLAAHAVQRNADPNHYARFWDPAVAIVTALAGVPVDVVPGAGNQVCTDTVGGSVPVGAGGWVRPAIGPTTSPYGPRWGTMHYGQDIGAACGTPVYAASAGTVVRAGRSSGYGNLIVVDHGGGIVSRYAHSFDQDVLVHVGDRVAGGQQIARVGTFGDSTGCHLHFEVQLGGQFIDPAPFMATRGAPF